MTLATGRVGLISDTHGLIRAEALAALRNSELIIHAGDIGSPEVLSALEQIAPVLAIKGNNDRGAWTRNLPDILSVSVNAIGVQVIHNLNELKIKPASTEFQVVISGHSHKPLVATKDGILFINPGSAGPRRFKLPIAVARLNIQREKRQAKIVEIKI
ncbi:MAG TPA: metallophosphoesterase family protein [Verrucomicrobiae bacterium]|nr:metallophosphoesterase family protein [Verrucomicrobiae bacterium]